MMFTSFSAVAAIATLLIPAVSVSASPLNVTERDLQARYAPVLTTCVNTKQVALTFDDGPYIWHRNVVDTLTKYGAKGTFFMNGNNYDCIYDSARVGDILYAISKGMEHQQHTWDHPELPQQSYSQIGTEFDRINTAILKITGKFPALFRPPYGDYNNNVLKVAAAKKQSVVTWDYDSGDSVGASMTSQKAVFSNFVKQKKPHGIFLMHETYHSTVFELLPYALQQLKAGGYQMVTLSECLGKQPFQYTQAPGKRDSSWHC